MKAMILAGILMFAGAALAQDVAKPTALPRLVDLGSKSCIPCKMMAPILEALTEEQQGVIEVVFIDVRKDPEAAKPYDIKLIPTQIFYAADGTELARHEGFMDKDSIVAQWAELGVELAPGTE